MAKIGHRVSRLTVAIFGGCAMWLFLGVCSRTLYPDEHFIPLVVVHLTVFVRTLQHFTAFYSIYSILQHFTAFYSICTLLQHFTAFYSNLQYLYVLTSFYNICTYFTAFYSILQHLYVHTCSCRREARSWDMR